LATYQVVTAPNQLIMKLGQLFQTLENLREHNKILKKENYALAMRIQNLHSLPYENNRLRELLAATKRLNGRFISAEVINVSLSTLHQQVVLNRGRHDGVFIGQPALDAHGIIGQVIAVYPRHSIVMLLSDRESAIPVYSVHNGVRAIAVGKGLPMQMELAFVPESAALHAGDVLVSSQLGGRFPEGYPVGWIVKIKRSGHQTFADIKVQPMGHLQNNAMVLLVWPDRNKTSLAPSAKAETT
jgi:rod shape-determining protein MreC